MFRASQSTVKFQTEYIPHDDQWRYRLAGGQDQPIHQVVSSKPEVQPDGTRVQTSVVQIMFSESVPACKKASHHCYKVESVSDF